MKSKMNSRLFVVAGSSQLLFLSAALLKNKEIEADAFKDSLVFSGKGVDKKRRLISDNIAKKVWEWNTTVWLEDVDYYNTSNQIKLLEQQFAHVDEIWVCMPYAGVELNLSIAFPTSKIIYFDDGLGSYILPNTLKEYLRKPSFIKKKLSLYFKRSKNALKNMLKFKSIGWPAFNYHYRYMVFSEFHQNKNLPSRHVIVGWSYLKTQLLKCKIDINSKLQLKSQNTCLILGQYFSLFGYINREEELQHYSKLCKNLESQGYAILWKEHPKNSKPFYKDLQKEISSILNLNDYYDDAIPVELIVSNLDLQLYMAATSTSLIILDKVFNYNICSSAPLIEHHMVGADKVVANLIIKELNDSQLLTELK